MTGIITVNVNEYVNNSGRSEAISKCSYLKNKNNWKLTHLNIEHGKIESSQIVPGWHSDMWMFEPFARANFVRIKNRWKNTYLHIEGGLAVQCSDIQPGRHNAQ